MLVACFLAVIEDFKEVLDGLQKSIKSLQDQMVSLGASEVPVAGSNLLERDPGLSNRYIDDEFPTLAERIELEIETLTPSGDDTIKVCEKTELVLQNVFTPLKNLDHKMLRCQFLVLDMPLTMTLKLDKIMAAGTAP